MFLDIWLQGSKLDGLQVLEQVKKDNADLPVVMISGHGNIETAVAAIKRGAYDFIEKPFKADRLILVAKRALENSRLKREVKELKQLAPSASQLVGRSPSMNQLRQTIERAAKANSRILIVGPAGAGKELTARTLHTASGRADGPFVVINAATITPERMEHELFGVEQSNGEHAAQARRARGGPWRHAVHRRDRGHAARDPEQDPARAGRAEVPARRRHRQGAGRCPHHLLDRRNLEEEIAAGHFREDLYHRLSVVPIRVPALSERREDMPELIDYFMEQISAGSGLPKRQIGQDAMAVLQSHDWPGNVRQLRNNVERLMILTARRTGGDHHRRHAAAGCRLDGADDADQQQWRAHHGPAAARGPRSVRARLFDCADQPFFRKYFSHGRVRWHGTLGAAPEVEVARRRLTPDVAAGVQG